VFPLPGDLDRLDPLVRDLITRTHTELTATPDDPLAWLRMAMVLHASEYYEPAVDAYGEALSRDRGMVRGWYHLFRLHTQLGRPDDADTAIARVLELDDGYAPAHWRLGLARLDQGRHAEAEASFRRALELDAEADAASIGLARALIAQDRATEAAALLEATLPGAGLNTGYVNLLLATAHRRLGQPEAADAALARAGGQVTPIWSDPWSDALVQLRPGYGARIERARALISAGRSREAIAELEALRREQPGNVTVLANLGIAYGQQGQVQACLEALRAALRVDPDHVPSHFQVAVTFAKLSQSPGMQTPEALRGRAIEHIDRALDINPTYAPAHSLRGDIHLMAGELDDAAARFEEAARCDPTDARFPFRAGLTYLQLQRWGDAHQAMERTIALDPDDSESWRALAVARLHLDLLDEAAAALAEAERRSPDDPRIQSVRDDLAARRAHAPEGGS
jgi:tetratricopeptide (TPR) repeat protein